MEHSPGQHLLPDHSAGDERTIGGYMAVHKRPAAFEGVDGCSYSADILTDVTGDASAPWGAYLFFVRWAPGATGEPQLLGHVESEFIVCGMSEAVVRQQLSVMPLSSVKATLDTLIRRRDDRA